MAKSRYANSRMFDKVTRTWNPCIIYPCYYSCRYCWTHYIVKKIWNSPAGRLYKQHYGKPALIHERLRVRFREGELVFTQDVGDLFADNVPDEYILEVLKVVEKFPRTDFLLLTKNPWRFCSLLDDYGVDIFSQNMIFGTTVETDDEDLYIEHKVSRAPPPLKRFAHLYAFLEGLSENCGWRPRAWVSVEPVIKFSSPRKFAEEIALLLEVAETLVVYVGYDNYGVLKRLRIPEPPLDKTLELIDLLKQHGIEVRSKTLRKAWNE